ncbi:MAG: DUF1176 domain-containing protein [uncultured Sulfurovum sp.]|uniref:DUF1176 domain-containing protein n=1 Tax=uncultured Sulfurovum sp. TaxID=269237 RepID=A0A6S6TXX3_9BACT|nr:MAG: DUF1176 domain-containing protein [uncultured Sulfurovum sp.]
MYMKKIIFTVLLISTQLLEAISFSHHDWEVVCDNTNTCRIVGYSTYYTPLPVTVLLTIKAGAKQKINAKVQLGSFGEETENVFSKLPSNFKLNMLINDKSYGYVTISKNELISPLSQQQTTVLLNSLKTTSNIVWKIKEHTWKLSDKGSSAVLLKVDEFQKRLNTTGALYKKGKQSEKSVLAPKPIPIIHAPRLSSSKEIQLNPLLMGQLNKELTLNKNDCYDIEQLDKKVTLYQLSNNKLLATKACWMAAYNYGSAYWVINKQAPFKPQLISTEANEYALNENNIGTLSASHKGRGIGDCFSHASWVWNGKTFQQSYVGSTGQCRAIAGGGAWNLPTLLTNIKRK